MENYQIELNLYIEKLLARAEYNRSHLHALDENDDMVLLIQANTYEEIAEELNNMIQR